MGESHATVNRASADRETLLAAAAIYSEVYADADGSIPASFQLIYMTGWAPHESQQRPLARGSANFSLKDLNLPEIGGAGAAGAGGVQLSKADLAKLAGSPDLLGKRGGGSGKGDDEK